MTCLMFLLLAGLCLWFAIIHLLNSDSNAGALARKFAYGLIEKTVGSSDNPPDEIIESEKKPEVKGSEERSGDSNDRRNFLRGKKME